MTSIYTIVAILIVVLTVLLVRQSQREGSSDEDARKDYLRDLCDGPSLHLAERIFDPGDYLWLRDEVRHPGLARALGRSRQQMAVRWLQAVRRSFDDFVSTPQPLPESNLGEVPSPWHLLWLTLRFHFLLRYAMLVVRVFGPYHRLVPPLKWIPSLSASEARKARYRTTNTGDVL